MKKFVTVVFIVLMSLGLGVRLNAEETIPLNETNLLNIAQLKGYKYDPSVAYYYETLNLSVGVTYTLVMSHDYLSPYLANLSSLYIAFEENDGSNGFEIDLINDASNGRAYVEFQTTTGWIDMSHIPVSDVINYEIILYQGTYSEFRGFVPYRMANEIMSYGGVLPVDYNALPTLSTIEGYIHAKDPNGNAIAKTLVSDTYSTSDKRPGTYRLVYETSYNQIRKKYYLDVKIFDLAKPKLSISSPLNVPIHEKWPLATIKSYVSVTDNVDVMSSADLVVVSDTYSTATVPGTYQVTFKATDTAGNAETLDVTINLLDTMPPMVYGPTSIYLYNTDTPLTTIDIRNHFEITDAVDKTNVTVTLMQDEYMQTTTPGRYLMTYQAKDTKNNTTMFTVYIHVVDHRGPKFETETLIIERSTAESMTDAQIIEWFKNMTASQGLSVSSVAILYNEYEGHEKQAGDYYVYLSYVLDGEDVTSRILVSVDDASHPFMTWIIIAGLGLVVIGTVVWVIIKYKKP